MSGDTKVRMNIRQQKIPKWNCLCWSTSSGTEGN